MFAHSLLVRLLFISMSLGAMLSSASAQTADYLYGLYSGNSGADAVYGGEWQLREIKIANPTSGSPTVTHSEVPYLGNLNSYIPGYGVTAGRCWEYINGLAVDTVTKSVYFNYTYGTDSASASSGNYYLQVYKANFNSATNSWTVVNIRTAAGLGASWGPYAVNSGGVHPATSGAGAFPRAALYTEGGNTYYITGGNENDSIWRINVNNPADLFTNDDFDHRSDMEIFSGGDWVVSGGIIYTATVTSSANYWVTQTLPNAYSTSSSADAVYFSYDSVVPYATSRVLQIAGLGGIPRLYGIGSYGNAGTLYRIGNPNGGSANALGIVDLGVFFTEGRFSDLSEGLPIQLAPIAPIVDLNSTPTSSTNTTFGANLVTNGTFSSGGSSPPSPWIEGSSSNGAVSGGRWVWTTGVTSGATLTQPLSIPAPTTNTNTSGGVTTTTTTTNALDTIYFDFGWANTADGTSALTVSYNNVVYATFNSASGDSSSATGYWTFSNGATGDPSSTASITSLTSGVMNFVEIYLPTGVATNSGNLTFNWTSDSSGDDVVLDNIVAEVTTTTTTTTETVGYDWAANYVTGAPAVSIADTDSSVTDADSTHIASATITLTNRQAGDVLNVITSLPAGITASSYNPTTGVITLSGSATKANYANAIERIGFSTTSSNLTSRVISVKVNDGALDSNTATTTISLTSGAPTGSGTSRTTPEDTPVSGSVTATDPNGDPLTYSQGTAPAHGTVTINSTTGAFTYTPALNYNGPDSFTVVVSDGNGGTVTLPVTITVTPVNDAPTGTGDSKTTPEDTPVSGAVTATDPDGNTLSYTQGTGPSHGSVSINSTTGAYTYTPALNYNGPDSFTVIASDGNGGTVTLPVTITVTPVNDAPTGTGDSKTTPEDTPVSGAVTATDPEGNPLSYAQGTGPSHGSVSINSTTGAYTYTPALNYNGPDSFTVIASDGNGGTVTLPVTITVTPVNDAPTGSGDSKTTPQNTPVNGAVTATDPEGNTLSYAQGTGPSHGSVSINSTTGTYTYTPTAGYTGPDNFTVIVSDGNGGTVSLPVTITVLPDHDGDGISDSIDLDDDNDGIPDTVEAATAINGGDTDGDGVPDILDLDSDNDGILDFVEARNLTPAQVDALDANNDGRLDGAVGADGIPDVVQTTPNAGVVTYTPLDFDGDSHPDFQDLDADNDGINDVREANGTDANGDGLADGSSDANGIRSTVPAGGLVPPNTDSDNWADFRDLDTDNDGINDVVEAGFTDPDNNGIVGSGQVPADTDGDGIANVVDGAPAVFGDSGDTAPLNSDNDPVPNFRDLDSDNDTVSDVIEGGNGPADTDGDGTISPTESGDTDGDGISNVVDNAPATYGDAGNPALPEGSDADTIPDYIDTDSDGDGLTDLVESGKDPAVLDPNGDGQMDNPTDPDGDGIPNNNGNDSKPAVFGGTSAPTSPVDSDNDGIPDVVDLDDDNDGIPDTVEAATAINSGDTDGDGVPDILDLDSDNDGILDMVEARSLTLAQVNALDANNDGRLDGAVGADGIPDVVQATPNAGVVTYTPLDTDGDGRPDFQDLDADNDGINDVREANGTDVNADGKADGPVDSSGIPSSVPAGGLAPPDTDGDGNPDFRDLDTDNDGINDVTEAGLSDPDNNGIAGSGQVPADTDGDGIADVVDGAPAVFGDSSDSAPLNSDNDPIPNFRDLDSDNDTVSDVIEGGNGPADTDGDGTISPTESGDTDGDGIPNIVDNNPTIYGDAGNTPVPNTDGDGTPNYLDPDSDGDGITDLVESGNDPALLDPNGDGQVDNPSDPDGDGIPNNNGNDTKPGDFGGATTPTTPGDHDGDGIPDIVDLDDDNDGIPDTVETANAINGGDTDGDGVPDMLDLDSDGDGILDVIEAGHVGLDANHDGRVDTPVGVNGLADVVETTTDSGVINYVPVDTDSDGRPDYVDLDSDNDTISDVLESGNTLVTDDNNDGLADGTPNSNGIVPGATAGSPVDSDADTQPDYRDVDSNNDGLTDIVDNGYGALDNNADGRIDNIVDADGDGIADIHDLLDDEFGWFPEMGCANWNLNSPADTDGDVFPDSQEYAFGGSPTKGDHLVTGTSRRQGLVLAKNGTGGLTASVVRPQGRYDVNFTLVASADLSAWAELSAVIPVVTRNGDGTDTLTWDNVQTLAPLTAARGFIRLKVETPCEPAGSYTLVQGWCLETASGSRQTHGLNFTSLPVYTGVVNAAAGATLTLTSSAGGTNLSTFLTAPGSYYIEFTDGAAEGHRLEVASGGVASLTLNLASANNTSTSVPVGVAGSHFVIRKHLTLGGVYPPSLYRRSSTAGSADQIQLYNSNGFDSYFAFPTVRWVKQGAGTSSQDGLVIPPGEAVYVIHSDSADSHALLQVGDVRYNDFIRPVKLGVTGINFVALGFPLNASPASLNMNAANGFVASSTVGGATLIQNWNGDATVNATGYTTNFQIASGNWRTQGQISNVTTNSPLFLHCRGTFLDVKINKLDWKHVLPWQPLPWSQPE